MSYSRCVLLFGAYHIYTHIKINIYFKLLFILHSEIIERSIRSEMNQGECRKPHLPVDNPDIMKFYEPVDKIKCGSERDWVMCEVYAN